MVLPKENRSNTTRSSEDTTWTAVVTVEHDRDHWERFRVTEAEYDRPDGQPIVDAVDYVFDTRFPQLDESERHDFHLRTTVGFDC